MRIVADLYDVHGKLIAKEGSEVAAPLIREVIRKGAALQKREVSLNQAAFLKDVEKVLEEPLYEKVFTGPKICQAILREIKATRIQASLFREVQDLKKTSPYTYRHFLLIGALAVRMALDLRNLGYRPREAFVYGMIHDIGKTRLSHRILNKKVRLTSNEYRVLRSYPLYSLLMLRYYLGAKGTEACRVAYEHHETLDGKGYPKGIKKMSKYTMLVAIIDIFDALVSARPYRKRAFTVRGALDKLITGMHTGKYGKLPVRLLVSYFRSGTPNFRTMPISKTPREADPEGNCYGKIAGA